MRFISIDPSLRNTAVVWGVIEAGVLKPQGYTLICTKKDSKISAATSTVNRCRETMEGIKKVLEIIDPEVCFCETPSGSQSSNAMKSYGVSCAYIALLEPKAIEVTPSQLKKAVTGKNTASKAEIMKWAGETYPDFPFPRHPSGVMKVTKAEHVCDAIAAAVAGMETNDYKEKLLQWN